VRPRRRPAAGFTLVEVVVSMAVVALAIVAALQTIGAVVRTRGTVHERRAGRALARALAAEIAGQAYAEPLATPGGPLGPEAGEADGTRAAFDDVDDYAGWSASPPAEADGTPCDGCDATWTRSVAVEWVAPGDYGTTRAAASGAKRITVTVTHEGREVARLVAVRTDAWAGPLAE
jgi:prepilin-type N-terminal cleavage/methylation domain-containing protein